MKDPHPSKGPHTRPTPSPKAVERFAALYREQRGIELSMEEALELSTRYLQLFMFGITPPPNTGNAPLADLASDEPSEKMEIPKRIETLSEGQPGLNHLKPNKNV